MDVCPFCESDNWTGGYGYAYGPLGSYTTCEDCEELIDFNPDVSGLAEDEAKRLQEDTERWRAEMLARASSPQPTVTLQTNEST
jgi:hypothetical protein